jgi:sterol desaturase/sphingolipid hydroxylase (fatty acid hydroxylase superfamily)
VAAPPWEPGLATQARRLASWLLFPLAVCALAAWAVVAPNLDWATPLGLPAVARDALVLLPSVISAYALIAALERLLPHRREWNLPHGDVRTDVLHLLLSGQGANAAFQATLAGAAVAGGLWISGRLGRGLWPAHWPALLQLGLALWVAELGHYWYHRLAHERALLWRLHAAHHSAQRLYWLNATRFHPLDLFALISVETLPLLLLGIDRRALLAYLVFRAVYGQIQHCNIELRIPAPLNWLFSSHELHRWHHSELPREANHNYAATLSCWDLLFGTYFRPADRAFRGAVGIADLPRFPKGYLAQLLAPLRFERIQATER